MTSPTFVRDSLASKAAPTGAASRNCLIRPSSATTSSASSRPRPPSSPIRPGRRQFLKLMGASLALAGVSACTRQPPEKIVPYVTQPEEIVPGRPLFFATAMPQGGVGVPLLAENHMGRPTKLEGNPEHPASLGATDVLGAGVGADAVRSRSLANDLDPRRSRTWGAFAAALQWRSVRMRTTGGAGVAAAHRADHVAIAHRSDRHAAWRRCRKPSGISGIRSTARSRAARRRPRDLPFRQSRRRRRRSTRIFWDLVRRAVRYTKDFAVAPAHRHARRRSSTGCTSSSPSPTITGANAGSSAGRSSRATSTAFAAALAAAVGAPGVPAARALPADAAKWVAAVAADLQAHRGKSVVVAGDHQPAAVHALARAINEALGNTGTTVTYARARCRVARRRRRVARRASSRDMQAGKVRRAADHRRQPGVHGAGGSRFHGRARQGRDARFISGCTTTRRPSSATGTCRKRTTSNRGATSARSTARSR